VTETRRAAASGEFTAMNIRTRKAIGCFALLAYLAVYALVAATLGAALLPILPGWAELIFYVAAGFIWVFPLKPLFGWMNGGA
jgi:predicted membrane channel-forming protein YqfA (hemolysin III family)